MKLYCANGCHDGDGVAPFKTEGFDRQPHETNCECGGRLLTGMERNARKKASKRGGRLRDQSRAESEAAEEFHNIVCSLGCWAKENREGHRCSGYVEAHHILPASWWRRMFGDLPEDRLLALVYNPVVGAPLCGGFHAAITAKNERIYFEELERELIEFAERLDREFPGRGVLARLQLECPPLPNRESRGVGAG